GLLRDTGHTYRRSDLGGNDGFRTCTGEPACDAMDLEGGAGPNARKNGLIGLTCKLRRADLLFQELILREGKTIPTLDFCRVGRNNVVIDSRDENAAVGFLGFRQ